MTTTYFFYEIFTNDLIVDYTLDKYNNITIDAVYCTNKDGSVKTNILYTLSPLFMRELHDFIEMEEA